MPEGNLPSKLKHELLPTDNYIKRSLCAPGKKEKKTNKLYSNWTVIACGNYTENWIYMAY